MWKLLLLISCSVLTACATGYQAKGLSGGFSEVRRTDFIYQVRFEGNGYTTPQRAEDLALLRAAELTLEKGFRFFTLLDESTRVDRTTSTTATQSSTQGRIDAFGNYRARTSVTGGDSFDVNRPTARLLVGMAPSNEVAGYIWMDARSVVADLGPKLRK